jgi:glutathione S-transferase
LPVTCSYQTWCCLVTSWSGRRSPARTGTSGWSIFAARDAHWQAKLAAAIREMGGHFRELDQHLANNHWLVNGTFTLADVAWTPNVHRMCLMEWPMAPFPHLSRWYCQLQQRPSFQQAVIDCEPPGMRATFAAYVAERRADGTSVADELKRSAA